MWRDAATLREEDFVVQPVWEWRADGLNEHVRPASVTHIPEFTGDGPVYIAATEFLTASGSRHFGYCSPGEQSGLDYTQPVILARSGPVALWNEASGIIAYSEVAKALGLRKSEVFPLSIRCLVPAAEGDYKEVVGGA